MAAAEVRAGEAGALLRAGLGVAAGVPAASAGVPDGTVSAGAPAIRKAVGTVARPCHTAQWPDSHRKQGY